MGLFSEKEMLDSTGVNQVRRALTGAELGNKVLHKRYDKSIITVVTLGQEDWESIQGRNTLRKVFFTPKDGYENRRRELSDMFPMSVVVSATKLPAGMKNDVLRNFMLLTNDNYIVLPIRKKKMHDALFIGSSIHGGAGKELFKFSKVIDLFIGGEILTDKIKNEIGTDHTLANLSWSLAFKGLMNKQGAKFDASINKIEEVFA